VPVPAPTRECQSIWTRQHRGRSTRARSSLACPSIRTWLPRVRTWCASSTRWSPPPTPHVPPGPRPPPPRRGPPARRACAWRPREQPVIVNRGTLKRRN